MRHLDYYSKAPIPLCHLGDVCYTGLRNPFFQPLHFFTAMKIFKIVRRAYLRARQDELATYVENVYTRTKDVPAYEPLQFRVDMLFEPLAQYKAALLKAKNRGLSEVGAKNQGRERLISVFDPFVTNLVEFAGNNIQLLIDAGLTVRAERAIPFTGTIPEPEIVRAISTGKRGQIRITLKDALPNVVVTHAVEYSTDGGQTWTNCTYHNNRNFVVSGLPASGSLLIRVKALGKSGKNSEWSETMTVAVL